MSQEKQKPLEIRIDGELVTPTINEQVIQLGTNAIHDVWRISRPLSRAFGQLVENVVTPIALDIHDAQHGSHLREEWFEKKHELATAAMRDEVGLD